MGRALGATRQPLRKAVRIHGYGGPECLQLVDAPIPSCGANDVLVRVVAAGIKPIDWKIRSGAMAQSLPRPFPFTLGADGAGVVAAVGGAATGFKTGAEVFFYAEFARGGSCAEYVAVAASQVARKPRTVPFAAAAALPTPGQAAWTALFDTARIEAGMRVLIHGGAGALGSVAVQLAKVHGLHVIATASGVDVDLVRSLGADEVIDYRQQRFEELVQAVDVVLDTQGGPTHRAASIFVVHLEAGHQLLLHRRRHRLVVRQRDGVTPLAAGHRVQPGLVARQL